MKIRLKQDFMGYKEGETFESVEGVFRFTESNEDVSEFESSSIHTEYTVSEDFVSNLPELFDITTETPKLEEPSTDSEEVSKVRSKEELEAKLNAILKDIDILRTLDYKYAARYIRMLESMAYTLEWALGNIDFE
jgi:hypothetical protein